MTFFQLLNSLTLREQRHLATEMDGALYPQSALLLNPTFAPRWSSKQQVRRFPIVSRRSSDRVAARRLAAVTATELQAANDNHPAPKQDQAMA
jgi:hypothetical protein